MPQSSRKTVYLETFGCQMNVLDSDLVSSQLVGLGYAFTDDRDSADVVLFNTCSVREQAENKVYSRLGELKEKRRSVIVGATANELGDRASVPRYQILAGPLVHALGFETLRQGRALTFIIAGVVSTAIFIGVVLAVVKLVLAGA